MEHTDKAFKGATYLYLPAEDVLIEPDNIKASPRIKDTLQIHIIKRFFDEQNVPYLQFLNMASDGKPFFTEFYRGGAWGHQKATVTGNNCCLWKGILKPDFSDIYLTPFSETVISERNWLWGSSFFWKKKRTMN